MKPTLPSAAALQQEKMQQQTAQIERLKLSLAAAEQQLTTAQAEIQSLTTNRKPSCAWCGYAAENNEDILTHILECENRPERAYAKSLLELSNTLVCVLDVFVKANAAKRAYRKELRRVQECIRDYWKIDAYPSYQFVFDALGETEAAKLGIRFDDDSDTTNGENSAT